MCFEPGVKYWWFFNPRSAILRQLATSKRRGSRSKVFITQMLLAIYAATRGVEGPEHIFRIFLDSTKGEAAKAKQQSVWGTYGESLQLGLA